MDAKQAAQNALQCVLEAKENDSLTIFCDDTKSAIGKAFEQGAKSLKLKTNLILLETKPNVFRKEITARIDECLTRKHTDIYINLLSGIREETPFRIKLVHKETSDHKTRLGHCPGVTMDMLAEGALALTVAEHRQMQDFAQQLMKMLKSAEKIEVTAPAGTQLSFSIRDRRFFTDTMMDWTLMKWMNLPTGEVIVAPVEDSLEGTLVSDIAIGGIGSLKKPLILQVHKGKVQRFTSEDKDVQKRVQATLDTDEMAGVVGEFAFGINPKARLVEFLEAEKMHGTLHIAFGDNADFPGGQNHSSNHMDFMMGKPTVAATLTDGSAVIVLADGFFKPLNI